MRTLVIIIFSIRRQCLDAAAHARASPEPSLPAHATNGVDKVA